MSSSSAVICQCVEPPAEGCPACQEAEAFTDPTLLADRARIAELRESGNNVTASFMRDELLNQLECFLDPAGAAYRSELQAKQGRAARELSLMIDPVCNF